MSVITVHPVITVQQLKIKEIHMFAGNWGVPVMM